MIYLSLETSSQICASALTDDEQLIAEHRTNIRNIHSAQLYPMIRDLLKSVSIEMQKVQAIAVSTGPGSFTGLRIGLSAAKGLAMGLGIPIIGVPTLQGLATHAPLKDGIICTLIRARADEYYVALYSRENFKDSLLRDIEIQSPAKLLETIPDGACLIGHIDQLAEIKTFQKRFLFAPSEHNLLSAFSVARIACNKFRHGDIEDVHSLEPMYHQQFIAGKPKKVVTL